MANPMGATKRTRLSGFFDQERVRRIVLALEELGCKSTRHTARTSDDGHTFNPPRQNIEIYALGEVSAGALRCKVPEIVINVIDVQDIPKNVALVAPFF